MTYNAKLIAGVLVAGTLICLAGAARAEDLSRQIASLDGVDFGAPAVSDKDLGRQRGAGLDGQNATVPAGGESNLAVILWDELKRNGGNGGSVATSGYNDGAGSTLTSSITGSSAF